MASVVGNCLAEVEEALSKNGLILDDSGHEKLGRYIKSLSAWNARISLVSRKSFEQSLPKILIDSFFPAIVKPEIMHGQVLDLGSGAGLPGIVFKIWDQNLEVTLVESVRKKALFLNHVVRELDLDHVRVLNVRAEGLPQELLARFDLVSCRGMGTLARVYPTAIKYLKPAGHFVSFKGRGFGEEVAELGTELGLERPPTYEMFRLPTSTGVLLIFHNAQSAK
jgi:16S rRNA (guanine527-N7)-methyltransferase